MSVKEILTDVNIIVVLPGMILTVYAKPNAKKNSVEWVDEDTVKISVTAKPEKGKANEAILEVLSEELGIRKTAMEIIRGKTTRIKQIEIQS